MSATSTGWRRVIGSVTLVAGLTVVSAPISAQTPEPSPSMSASMVVASPTPIAAGVEITLSDFDIAPDVIEVAGPMVVFSVTNTGITPHNLSLRDEAGALVGATPEISQNGSEELMVDLIGPGTYTFFCSLPGHESLGMSGSLVVSPAGEATATSS